MMFRRFRHIAVIVVVLLALSSCQLRPMHILSREEMVDILYDIQLTESTVKSIYPRSTQREKQEYYDAVFKKHNITREQFEQSVEWYSHNPRKYSLVYEDLLARVEILQKEVEAEQYSVTPEVGDSISDQPDTTDIWRWHRNHLLVPHDEYGIPRDSVLFKYNDSTYFGTDITLKWMFDIKVYSPTDDSVVIAMHTTYNDTISTTTHTIAADSVKRHIKFIQTIPYPINPQKVELQFIDSLQEIKYIQIDSVSFLRIAEDPANKVPADIIQRIAQSRDSCDKAIESQMRLRNIRQHKSYGRPTLRGKQSVSK